MNETKYWLAVDIGASSGRHILGWRENGGIATKEIYRFPNGVEQENGHLVWDLKKLLFHVKAGIREAFSRCRALESLSIDTWGCDYVLLNGEEEIFPCYAYRDDRTAGVIEKVHERVPFETLYHHTGCQFQPFTTVYQLGCDERDGRLAQATDFLMIPEYLIYRLTGVKRKEFTNATTTGLVNVNSPEFDRELIQRLGLPERLFPKLSAPGTAVGCLTPDVAAEVGGNVRVVLCATHDTASAVEGIPMSEDAPYISSGTWSLLGIKTPSPLTDEASRSANFSNEGGVGYNRYQKNIMGMWLINRLRGELCPDRPFDEIVSEAMASGFEETVDADAAIFLAPDSMRAAFDSALSERPQSEGDYFRCAYRSLARSYQKALDELEENTGRRCDKIYIVGGGAKNRFLNDLTEQFTKKQVIALPIEATAIGNLKIQMNSEEPTC